MRVTRNAVLLSAIAVFAAACGRQEVPPPDKLDDLTWLDTLTFPAQRAAVASELELGFLPDEEQGYEEPAPAPRPVAQRTSAPRQASAAPVYRAPAPAPAPVYRAPAPAPARTESNAKRDAAIGAVGGAVIGATVAGGGNRVRGAIIGGAAGAVIGGVIGHTVDRKPVPNHFQFN